MVDNTAQNATATMATDDIAGVHYQIIKQAYGALDSATLVSTTNPLPAMATGNVATGVADSGNPVKIGGVANNTGVGVAAGQRSDAWLGLNGQVMIGSYPSAPADGAANSLGYFLTSNGNVQPQAVAPFYYNGATYDRVRGTVNGALVIPVTEPGATFRGRSQTFRIPGLAGTAGQKLFTLHNATGSAKVVYINRITVDMTATVAKAVTVLPPVIRVHRVTVLPSAGTACPKVAKDTALTSNASVTCLQGASADGTGTTITATIPASSILSQEFAPRLITAAGYEMFDRAEMLVGEAITLRALEGIVVELVYVLATQNPITDMWIVGCDWYEV